MPIIPKPKTAMYVVYCLKCDRKFEIPFSDPEYQEKANEWIKNHKNLCEYDTYIIQKNINIICSSSHVKIE
jgi:hypothetical protein